MNANQANVDVDHNVRQAVRYGLDHGADPNRVVEILEHIAADVSHGDGA